MSAESQDVLMPQPASITTRYGTLPLDQAFTVIPHGPASPRLDRAVARAMEQLARRTGISSAVNSQGTHTPQLLIDYAAEGAPVQGLDEPEAYELEVTPASVHIKAATVLGVMHALQTTLQLVQSNSSGYFLPAVTIKDEPRFRWRGLMIDCARHFEPLDVLKRTLDGMATVKMNVFHWHLIDDQGFRIESLVFPALTAKGSAGLFYTQAEARELVAYARDRGIRVIPEFEMPGHSTAWLVAYPELSSGTPPHEIRTEFGISDFAVDPTREETYRFLEKFLAEMVTIFPDEYVHIGGDETPAPDWKTSPRIQAFMHAHALADSEALQAHFNLRVVKILGALNKRMIGWDEILNGALPKSILIQSWRGEASLERGAREGFAGVLSAPFYLDGMRSAREHYLADPIPSTSTLTPDQRKLILGGEVCMWAEQIDRRSIDSRVWPRAAAIAERLWSPANRRDVDSMYRRLDATSLQLESLGLTHLSHEDAALRQLAGGDDIASLQVFASVLEPVSFSDRYAQQKTSQLTALDRFVDAVSPDRPSRRVFAQLVAAFLQDPHNAHSREQLVARFAELSAAMPKVLDQTANRPLLHDVQPRAEQLTQLARTATEAVGYVADGRKPPAGWKQSSTALLATAKVPAAIVRFTFLDALTALFNAVPQ